jgi:signal transduction histidine kinase
MGVTSFAVATAGIEFGYSPSLQTLHVGLFAALSVLAVGLGVWIARTRRTRGARLFALVLFGLGARTASDVAHGVVGEVWTLLAVLAALNPLLELWTLLTFVVFAGRYAGIERLTGRRARRASIAVGALAAAVVATNPLHGLVVEQFLRLSIPFTHVGVQRGVLGVGLVGLNVALLLLGAGLLAYAMTAGIRPAWWPATVLALALSQGLLVVGLQLRLGGVMPQYDYTAIGLASFLFLTTLALVEHGLRRIEVVAREDVLDDIEDAVVLLDTDGTVRTYNAAATRLVRGIETGDPFFERFDALDRDTLQSESGETAVSFDPDERDWLAPSDDATPGALGPPSTPGQRRHFVVHTEYVTRRTTDVIGHAVRFVETTALERRSRELERKNDQLDTFAETVSHDLRNPLNVATGSLQLATEAAEDDPPDVDAAVASLERVSAALDRMATIIDDILALVDTADPVTDTDPVDFEAVTRAAWATVDTRAATLEFAGGGQIVADETRLQRLLENLVRNAVDHVGDDVTIEIGLTADGFAVADDGPGIPADERDRIFEHGYTTGADGTGLGLSIVRQLAEAHGWAIGLEPDADGAKFVVTGATTTPDREATELPPSPDVDD